MLNTFLIIITQHFPVDKKDILKLNYKWNLLKDITKENSTLIAYVNDDYEDTNLLYYAIAV